MAEQLLDRAQVRPAFEQMGGKRVPQGMRGGVARTGPRGAATVRSRRRTSEGERRRPRLERNSAGSVGACSERRARACTGSARARAGPARRPGRSASWSPCRAPAAPRRRSRCRRCPGSRPPRSAARRSRRARTSRGRAARAACAPGCGRAAARPRRCAAPSAAARCRRGVADQIGGVLVKLPALDHLTEERADRGELARDRAAATARARPRALRRRGARRSGAGSGSRPRSGATPASVAQRGKLPDVAAVGAARLLGHAARGELAVEAARARRARRDCAPAHLRSSWDVVLHQRRDRPRRDARQLVEAGETPAHEPPALPWHPVQGPGDASTAVYSVLRKQVRGRSAPRGSALCVFATATARPLWRARAGRRSRSTRSGRTRRADPDGSLLDVDRRLHRHLVVELLDVGDRHPDAAVRGRRAERAEIASVPWMPAPA